MSKIKGDPGYRPQWCIHYRYNRSEPDTCEAGVDYEAWRGISHDKQPCFLDETGLSKPDAIHCPHLQRPTPEEIAAHEEWSKKHREVFGIVMVGIASWRKEHKGRSVTEIVKCPACGGSLHLSIAACNGHVHGHCETEGCVSWME